MSKAKSPAGVASVRDLVDKFTARVRQNLEAQLETLATDLYKALEDPGGKVDAKKAIAEIVKASKGDQEGKADQLTRLLSALRMLDEATSLRALLEGLGRGAAMEATRVAVLLVDGEMLRPFGDFGFAVGPRPVDSPLDASPPLARAVQERIRMPLAQVRSADLPQFMRQPVGSAGIAIPVVVGGEVVSLLYAEGPEKAPDGASVPVWTEHVEILTRYASARLEAVTSRRTVEVFNTTA